MRNTIQQTAAEHYREEREQRNAVTIDFVRTEELRKFSVIPIRKAFPQNMFARRKDKR
jgi:hypothetical protein